MRLLTTFALMLFVSATLAGCVDSETPLFPENEAVTDSSFVGSYTAIFSDKQTPEVQIFLRGNKYIAAKISKNKEGLLFIATLYRYQDNVLIAQVRVPKDINYNYFIIGKTASGFTATLFPCPVGELQTCTKLTDKSLLTNSVGAAAKHLEAKDTLIFERKSDLEH